MSVKTENSQNDWDEEDDWDEWGDAEDGHNETSAAQKPAKEAHSSEKSNVQKEKQKSLSESQNKSNSIETKSTASTISTDDGKSWSSSFKPWGFSVSSVLTSATEGLGALTNTVSQGLNNVIGAPDPEELARTIAADRQNMQKADAEPKTPQEHSNKDVKNEPKSEDANALFGLPLVSGVTTLGSKVLNTGLDTLEGIGKKTMNILQENDPLLMNKRKMLGIDGEKPNLSDMLKEAKREHEELEHALTELSLGHAQKQQSFESIFENSCGQVHLEALQILSKECDLKLQALLSAATGEAHEQLKETLAEVQELFELEELEGECPATYGVEDLRNNLQSAKETIDLKLDFEELINYFSEILDTDNEQNLPMDDGFVTRAIEALAKTCALEIKYLHKAAELLMVKEHHSTASELETIALFSSHFHVHLKGVANHYATLLKQKSDADEKTKINSIYTEMCLATDEIEKAFKLFLPILQMGTI